MRTAGGLDWRAWANGDGRSSACLGAFCKLACSTGCAVAGPECRVTHSTSAQTTRILRALIRLSDTSDARKGNPVANFFAQEGGTAAASSSKCKDGTRAGEAEAGRVVPVV